MTNSKIARQPMRIGQRVKISPRLENVVAPIYHLPPDQIYQVTDILYGPGGKQLYELCGRTVTGNVVTFILAPKMVVRVKAVQDNARFVAQTLAQAFQRPESSFRAIAAAQQLVRRVKRNENGLVVSGH